MDLICLTGVNGSGKTTVMELIYNLLQFLRKEMTAIDIQKDRPNVLSYTEFAQLDFLYDEKVFSLVWGDPSFKQQTETFKQIFIFAKDLKDYFIEIEAAFKKSDEDFLSKVKRDLYGTLLSTNKSDKRLFKETFEEIQDKIGKKLSDVQVRQYPGLYYLPTNERSILDLRYSSIPKFEFNYDIAQKYTPETEDLNALLVYYDYAYPDKYLEIKNWINNTILTDKALDEVDRPLFKARVKTNNGDLHGLELLSSGEKTLLIIAIQFYLRASENIVFLIDEIDESLHPEYQTKIMQVIKEVQNKFKCQVIISSHSRFIWNEVPEKGMIRLTEVVK